MKKSIPNLNTLPAIASFAAVVIAIWAYQEASSTNFNLQAYQYRQVILEYERELGVQSEMLKCWGKYSQLSEAEKEKKWKYTTDLKNRFNRSRNLKHKLENNDADELNIEALVYQSANREAAIIYRQRMSEIKEAIPKDKYSVAGFVCGSTNG